MKTIRTRTPYLLLGSDFSAQEPRLTAQACGDPKMIQAYRDGKDLYSEIASVSFKYPYVECLEHFPKGTPIKKGEDGNWRFATKEEIESKTYDKLADGEDVFYEGKGRRTQAKSILLGILYGRQSPSIAKQLGCTPEEATEIRESVYREFPKLKEFEKSTIEFAQKHGYVQTLWGRKRRLPAIRLPDYEFKWSKNHKPKVDLLDFSTDIKDEIPPQKISYYTTLLNKSNWKDIPKIIKQALYEDEIVITSNTDKKARATRQSVNSVIQGSAADMTKKALLEISRNERLNELGFRILVTVHDEFIGECPRENAKECRDLFAYCMNHCADDKLSIPVSCDVVVSELWEGDTVEI